MEKLSFKFGLFILCISLIVPAVTRCKANNICLKEHVALFIFGDALLDVGNNNYNNTLLMANYIPYGETFFKYPTGRSSNGRLVPDFIAEYANLPFLPPYLQLQDNVFTYGVNFASSGSGVLVETRQGSDINLKTQLNYFKNVQRQLRQQLGDSKAKYLLSRAVYLFHDGADDYVFPIRTNSSVLRTYTPQEYVGWVIGNITEVIKEVYKIGGRKFVFLKTWPLGCAPGLKLIALSRGAKNGSCLEEMKPYIQLHNEQLSNLFEKLQLELKGFKYSLPDLHTFIIDRINNPSHYGFKEVKEACCGSGTYKGILSCGGRGDVKEYDLCENVEDYLFFDSAHLTEKVFKQFAEQAWSGNSNFTGPYNIKAIFESY